MMEYGNQQVRLTVINRFKQVMYLAINGIKKKHTLHQRY